MRLIVWQPYFLKSLSSVTVAILRTKGIVGRVLSHGSRISEEFIFKALKLLFSLPVYVCDLLAYHKKH